MMVLLWDTGNIFIALSSLEMLITFSKCTDCLMSNFKLQNSVAILDGQSISLDVSLVNE